MSHVLFVRELVQTFIRIYFARLFDGRRGLSYVVLDGGHAEAAVVTVVVDRDVESYTSIPTIVPRHAGTQIFVYHPQVAAYLRHQEARFLLETHDWLVGHNVGAATMYEQIAAVCDGAAQGNSRPPRKGPPRLRGALLSARPAPRDDRSRARE